MMSTRSRYDDAPSYNPRSERRSRTRELFARTMTLRDVLLAILATIAALGWTITSPGRRIAMVETRVTAAEKDIGTLSEAQRFTNYMLCMNARRTDPASAPPGCDPIIESWRHK